MKKLLVTRETPLVQPLRGLIEQQLHRTLAIWAVDCAPPYLELFERQVPDDPRPREALLAAGAWMRGEIKMPEAKRAAHATHNAATRAGEAGDAAACAAARAMGHVVGTVHTDSHAMGLAMYGLTAVMLDADPQHAQQAAQQACDVLYARLKHWQREVDAQPRPWAAFLLREGVPNRERQRRERMEQKARDAGR